MKQRRIALIHVQAQQGAGSDPWSEGTTYIPEKVNESRLRRQNKRGAHTHVFAPKLHARCCCMSRRVGVVSAWG